MPEAHVHTLPDSMDTLTAKTHEASIKRVMAAAISAVQEVMLAGITKHPPFGWIQRTDDEDIDKAIRHLMTYRLQRDGHSPRDNEDHILNALCRIAMVIAKREVFTS